MARKLAPLEAIVLYNSDDPYGDGRGQALAEWYADKRGISRVLGVAVGTPNGAGVVTDTAKCTAMLDALLTEIGTDYPRYLLVAGLDWPSHLRCADWVADASAFHGDDDSPAFLLSMPEYRNGVNATSVYDTARTQLTNSIILGNGIYTLPAAGTPNYTDHSVMGGALYADFDARLYLADQSRPCFSAPGTDTNTGFRVYAVGVIGGGLGTSLARCQANIQACLDVEARGGLKPQDGICYANLHSRFPANDVTSAALSTVMCVEPHTIEHAAQLLEQYGFTVRRSIRNWNESIPSARPDTDFDLGWTSLTDTNLEPTNAQAMQNVLCIVGTSMCNATYAGFSTFPTFIPGSFWIQPTSFLMDRATAAYDDGCCCVEGNSREGGAASDPFANMAIARLLAGDRWIDALQATLSRYGHHCCYGDPLYQPFSGKPFGGRGVKATGLP